MSSSDFLQIAARAEAGKSERLFRACISAFCSLTRPSRREIGQIEDLTLPLFDSVSAEGLRYAAAALSECAHAPEALVRRLCESTVDIAAPLLARSKALTDIDLIALIGRHGLPHARAIAKRKELNVTIANLIQALEKPMLVPNNDVADEAAGPAMSIPAPAQADPPATPGADAENMRHRLRGIMLAQKLRDDGNDTRLNPADRSTAYAKLRETALTGNAAFFQTALADALDIDFATARMLLDTTDTAPLSTALRALDIGEDKAFLIVVAVFPKLFPHPQAIRLFLDRYRLLHPEAALDRVKLWKADRASQTIVEAQRAGANSDEQPTPKAALRAS